MRPSFIGIALGLVAVAGCSASDGADEETETAASALHGGRHRQQQSSAETLHTSGAIDLTNPFFLPLGINGRSCGTCHDARAGWTMTSRLAQQLFCETDGLDPLFRPHDGANNPNADVSTVAARRSAYSMALTRAVTRFTRTVPATAEYTVTAVDDPYGFGTPAAFSSFRRPNSAANIAKEVAITWTGTPGDMTVKLMGIMNGAAKSHAKRPDDVPVDQQLAGAQFMFGLTFAQASDRQAGRLDAAGALGGAANLQKEPFYVGINALTGDVLTGAPFNPESFEVFAAWENLRGSEVNRARARIARGEEAFYSLEFDITGVAGLNDALGQPVIKGRCTTCHNSPNTGGQSEFRLMDTGVADGSRRTRDMPLITVQNKTTGAVRQTMDLGRATATGLWADIGKFKAPTLRGVGSRAPYFHDGSAQSLEQVLEFYKHRFGVKFRGNEDDLIAFLEAL
jgi:cytochrome c peroxidase